MTEQQDNVVVPPLVWHGVQVPPVGPAKSLSQRLHVQGVIEFNRRETGNDSWPLERPMLVERAARQAWSGGR